LRFPQNFIEEVKYRNKIEDVVSSYVNLKRAGSNYQGVCPFHSEKTPSFTVFPNTETFHCFGCGAGGDVISFIMRSENLEYPGAIEFLAKRAGLQMPESEEKGETVKRTRFYAHLLCSVLAAIGGYVYFMHVGSGSPSHADGAEMNAIASSIVGGTMLTGGVGNIIGTFFGVLSLSTIKNIVSSLGLDEAWWTNITVAFMLCLFLLIQSIVLRRKAGAKK